MKTFIAYSNKSSVTGKLLKSALQAKRKRTDKRAKCDLLIRWGSTESFSRLRARVELNSLEAVKRTANKLAMIETLSQAGIVVPQFSNDSAQLASLADESGNVYIRSKAMVVRYGNDFNPATDLYFTKPVVNKRREYRVHVFRNKILGIYEKVPLVEGAANRPKLFKSDTCKFVRCDPAISRVDRAAQELCIASVSALGLDIAGVDLIRDRDGNFTICEVNSSPGLNNNNIERLKNEISNHLSDRTE